MSGKSTSQNANEIKFQATVYKVQTLTDNGIRLSLDLPEDAVMAAAQLMECQRFGVVLSVTAKNQS
jgi:hypothetical protein